MKSKDKIIIILIAVVFVGLISGFITWRVLRMMGKQIEDVNGDSKEPAVITDRDILEDSFGCVSYMISYSAEGKNASGVDDFRYEECDNRYSRLSIKKMSGIHIENVYLGNGLDVTYTIDSTVSAGNFRIVITDEENHILHTIPIDQKATVTMPTEAGKLYFVKYVGESAEIRAELWRTPAGE